MTSLTDLVSKLNQQTSEANRPLPSKLGLGIAPRPGKDGNCLFLGGFEDKEYVHLLKGMFNGYQAYTVIGQIELLAHLEIYCKQRSVNKVITTRVDILKQLISQLSTDAGKNPKVDDYAGSLFTYKGIEILIIDPLKHIHTVPYGRFITNRFISKLVSRHVWREPTQFKWDILRADNIDAYYQELMDAALISVDIETFKVNLAIRCISFTGMFIESGRIRSVSLVLPIDSTWALIWAKKFCELPAPKIFQNGKYDVSYLLRYNIPVYNWLWDTKFMMHSWYAELPKDLGFLNAFFLREVVFWKDLSETQDLHEYYRYNAMDSWATANVMVEWILQAPDWAKRNYQLKFPLVFPCLLAEMTGIERDVARLETARRKNDEQEGKLLATLRTIIGIPDFNPGSSQQVKKLLKVLGCDDIDSSEEKDLKKAQLRHPLNAHIIGMVIKIRKWRKENSNYLRLDSDADKGKDNGAKEFCGRILYSINPDGTDTGRNASKEHHFWTGLQIQNITRGPSVKQTIRASGNFYLGESDLEQAESRDTAYISGEVNLINAVESPRDFHSVNCSAFFGVPYERIFDDRTKKTLDKKLRDLAKRVNHGANYNMGVYVLIDTMGLDKIWEAGRMLKLPTSDPRAIGEYLLACFHKTYPAIKGKYYVSVTNEIGTTNKLVSRAYHHTAFNRRTSNPLDYIEQGDWTRYCFGRPDKSKTALNSYVAHCPQSLNARTLDEAFLKVFYEIALPNPEHFRLHAQIHDSILFSYSPEKPELAERVRECMEIPITIRDVSGNTREFVVPAALKIGHVINADGTVSRATYWSETE